MSIVAYKGYCIPCAAWQEQLVEHFTIGLICPKCLNKIAPGNLVPRERKVAATGWDPFAAQPGARQHATSAEVFDPNTAPLGPRVLKVAERDGWVCHLCGQSVDPEARNKRRASLDHVIPRSRGGSNGFKNLKLAHRDCNWERGSRPVAEVQVAA